MKTTGRFQRIGLSLLLLALLVFAVFGRTVGNAFICFDDPGYVVENPFVTQGLTLQSIPSAFTEIVEGNRHPLTMLSHMLDVELFGLDPRGHHATSVVLHLLASWVLLLLVESMTGSIGVGLSVAALFAVHPLHVEPVVWVSSRKDLLCAIFWFLSMRSWLDYCRSGRRSRYGASLAYALLSMASKPMAMTLPAVLLMLDVWPLRRTNVQYGGFEWVPNRVSLKDALVEKVPFLLLSAGTMLTAVFAQKSDGAIGNIEGLSFGVQLANAVVSYATYLVKTVWPSGFSVFYPHPALLASTALPLWKIAVAAILLTVLSLLAWRERIRRPHLIFGWAFFLGTLFPTIGLVQLGGQAMADRYTYVPLVGLSIAGAVEARERLLVQGKVVRRWASVIAAVIVVLLSSVAYRQVGFWRDGATLFRHALEVTAPTNHTAMLMLGMAYRNDGRYAEAVDCFREVTRLRPDLVTGWANLGKSLAGLGKNQDALSALQKAMEIDPSNPSALNSAGVVLVALGRPEEGVASFRKSLSITPDDGTVWKNLGSALTGVGRLDDAASAYGEAMARNPRDVDARHRLAVAFLQLGRPDEAIPHLREVVRLMPGNPVAWYNLGNAWDVKGKSDEAVVAYRRALELRPGYEKAEANLQRILEGRAGR